MSETKVKELFCSWQGFLFLVNPFPSSDPQLVWVAVVPAQHGEVLQCYYELYSDGSVDCVIFKMQVQKFASKQLQCRTERTVNLWFNSLARKCNSPVTEEKEMVLSLPHNSTGFLLTRSPCSPFRINYLQSSRDSNTNYYQSLHKHSSEGTWGYQ